jgi:hypothetical protein
MEISNDGDTETDLSTENIGKTVLTLTKPNILSKN